MNNLTAFDYSYKNNVLNVEYKPINKKLEHWCDEIDNTVKAISQSTNKPIYIAFSGGIDSEIIVNSFIKNNIPFRILIVEFSDGLNKHDTDMAKEFCDNNNISYTSVSLNVHYFFTEGINRYISQGYRAIRIFRYLQLFILETIESLGGCAVLGSGEQVYCTVDGEICLNREYGYFMSLNWCKDNNTTHYPYFFEHNSELFASYMKLDLIEFMLERPEYFINYIDNMSTEKIIIYHRYWPKMLRRFKFHGFENMLPFKNKVESQLRNMFPDIQPTFFSIKNIKEQLGI
jgi:hypothetical protein